jgi:hypothetical protein
MSFNYITKEFRKDFPNITYNNSRQTSESNEEYNCISWALGNTHEWIWPGLNITNTKWPIDIPRLLNKNIFIKLFESYGFKLIPNKDTGLVFDLQKIVLYVDYYNKPTHAARQLPSGRWTSKIGANLDIEHDTPEVLEGPLYGKVDIVMAKKIF